MSLSPSHDQLAPAVTDTAHSEPRSGLAELAIAIGFAGAIAVAMIVWLYMLAMALWEGLRWLIL
jgi:hypothetical protein